MSQNRHMLALPQDAGPHYINLCSTLKRQRRRRVRDLVWTNIQLAAVFILASAIAIATEGQEISHLGILGYITFGVAISILGLQAAYQAQLLRDVDDRLEEMACVEEGED